MLLIIICPNCETPAEVDKKADDIEIINGCDCVAEGELSLIEWTERILEDWEGLTILKEPDPPAR